MASDNKNPLMSYNELRIIGISLAVLSLGLAIAWFGFVWFSKNKPPSSPAPSTTSPSANLK